MAAGIEGGPPSPTGDPGAVPAQGRVAGLRALLVEDQTIIALDTESMLTELGAVSVQSFTTADTALTWLAGASADIGILDIALGAATSYPVADILAERGIPFVFTTGYGDTHPIPPRFATVPIVHKPYVTDALADGIALCLRLRTRS